MLEKGILYVFCSRVIITPSSRSSGLVPNLEPAHHQKSAFRRHSTSHHL